MRYFKWSVTIAMAAVLAACGGGGSDVPAKPRFTSQVSFGDSLSDVGSYKVGLVAAIGGGQFTINIPNTATNWTELTAQQFGLSAPCAAETGLDNGSGAPPGTPTGTVIPVTDYATCTGYAQGGARVTNPIGIGNKALGGGGFALTVPVATQISNHLAAHGGSFTGHEIVFVMAGANDVFYQLGLVGASAATPTEAVTAMATEAGNLVNDINTLILANGAKYVVVVNIPDIVSTPFGATLTPGPSGSQVLVDTMVTTFNSALQSGLSGTANVLLVDAYNASKDEVAHPSKYNLTDVTHTACDLASPYNPLASSLGCNANSLSTGVSVSDHYLFADTVHPTPYGHALFATYVLQAMTNKGWY